MSLVLKSNLGETHNAVLFQENMLTKKVVLPINKIHSNMKSVLQSYLNFNYTGKCFEEGYIEKNSIKIISYTNGLCVSDTLEFHVVFTCNICIVSDNMMLECKIENKNLSGIKCNVILNKIIGDEEEYEDKKQEKEDNVSEAIVIFCSRDHHYGNDMFNSVEVNDKILVKVIGSKYELFDDYICVIGKFFKKT